MQLRLGDAWIDIEAAAEVRLAPLRESGHQLLMRALASQGNVAEALRVYTNVCAVLRDELGVSPCTATRAIHEQLLNA